MATKGEMLKAMEFVSSHPNEEDDETRLHDMARKMMEGEPSRFNREMAALERAYHQALGEAAKGAKREKGPEETDAGSERCLALCEGLIEKWSKEATT